MRKHPCYNCETRHFRCYAECQCYQEYEAEKREEKSKLRKDVRSLQFEQFSLKKH